MPAITAHEDTIYDQLSRMHSGPRVLKVPPRPEMGRFGESWQVVRAEDIRFVLQHPEIFSSRNIAGFSRLVGEAWDLIPLEKDPPEHSKYRAVMNGVFAPAKINAMEQGVRDRAVDLIEAFAGKGGCEFVEAFARPFPVSIFMQLMGLPEEDADKMNAWEYGLLHSHDPQKRVGAARGFH